MQVQRMKELEHALDPDLVGCERARVRAVDSLAIGLRFGCQVSAYGSYQARASEEDLMQNADRATCCLRQLRVLPMPCR